ncbi:MAG: fructose-6-phosphate aldolase [Myxococcales bacterium]|nr:fructose-6-phosphate aldolase [Myxococcales bacterium]|tara:strand:+ start:435 stop:1085 length:651 start_codon:yes stop_codon:yes gene_type:complete
MLFFIDTADINEIRRALSWGICDGVTTNPSLVAKTEKSFSQIIDEILAEVDGPVSLEVTATDYETMMEQARTLHARGENVVVKLPMTPDGIRATRTCAEEGMQTNVTLVFSPTQALIAAKAGATYVSPFIGRLDDVAADGMSLLSDIVEIYQNHGFATQVLAASIRHPEHVADAARIGADVATIPIGVLEKLFRHPLTDVGLARFMEDAKRVPGLD